VILFTLDVAVRRIQIDREEWLKATQTLRRLLFFWQPPPRPAQAEESLAALLARRDEVRSKQTAPSLEPAPELFQPERIIEPALPGTIPGEPRHPAASSEPPPVVAAEPEETAPTNTTSRLLEAKKRAQKRRE